MMLLFYLGLIPCVLGGKTYRLSTIDKLRSRIAEYSTEGLSVVDENEIEVNIKFSLLTILSLDAAKQVFSFGAGLLLEWIDPNLSWNESKFENIKRVSMGPVDNTFWTPSLIVANGVDKVSNIARSSPFLNSDGRATMTLIDTFTVSCQVDVTDFPFDTQICSVMCMPTQGFAFNPDSSENKTSSTLFSENSEWKLVSVTHRTLAELGKTIMVYDFTLERRNVFYITCIILPMTLCSILNACVFLLPADSGEKMSYLISIFVSYAVFLNFVNDSIPKSGSLSRLSLYLAVILVQSGLAIVSSLCVLCLHHGRSPLKMLKGAFKHRSKIIKVKIAPETKGKAELMSPESAPDMVQKIDGMLFIVFIVSAFLSILVFVW